MSSIDFVRQFKNDCYEQLDAYQQTQGRKPEIEECEQHLRDTLSDYVGLHKDELNDVIKDWLRDRL